MAWVCMVNTLQGDGGPGCAGLATWVAGIAHLGTVHDKRELESLKAAARQRVAAGHVFTPALGPAHRSLLESRA